MKIFFYFFIVCFCSSCSAILGIHQPQKLSDAEMMRFKKKIGIQDSATFFIDKDYLEVTKYCSALEKKHHLQPLQIKFYNKEGKLMSFFINCNMPMKGTKLNWNNNEVLDSFYHKTATQIDSCVSLNSLTEKIKSTNNSRISWNDNNQLVAIIFWNKFMLKQSRNMIQQYKTAIRKNEKLAITTIYVNDVIYLQH